MVAGPFVDDHVLMHLLSLILRRWKPPVRFIEALLFLSLLVLVIHEGRVRPILVWLGTPVIVVNVLSLFQNLFVLTPTRPFLGRHIRQRIRLRVVDLRHFPSLRALLLRAVARLEVVILDVIELREIIVSLCVESRDI